MLNKRNLADLFPALVVIFVDALVRMICYPLIIFLMSTHSSFLPAGTPLSLRLFYLSIMLMLTPFFSIFGRNYMGTISDIIKRKNALLITTSGMTIALFLGGVAVIFKSVVVVAITNSLIGIFSGSKPVALASVMDSIPKEERSRAISVANFSSLVGLILGPILSGVLSNQTLFFLFTPETPFFIGALFNALAIIFVAVRFKETFGKKHERKFTLSELYTPFTRTFSHKKMRLLVPQTFFLNVYIGLFSIAAWTYLTNKLGVQTTELGFFMATAGVSALIATLFIVSPLTHRYCTEKIMTYGLLLLIILVLITTFVPTLLGLWIMIIPLSIIKILLTTCSFTNASHASGKHHQGWAMGINSAAVSLGWLVASLMTPINAQIGFINAVYCSIAALAISTGFIIWHRALFHPNRLEEEIEPAGE